jgi:hypothetical protein
MKMALCRGLPNTAGKVHLQKKPKGYKSAPLVQVSVGQAQGV